VKAPPRSRSKQDPIGPEVLLPQRLQGVRSWKVIVTSSGDFELTGWYGSYPWQRHGQTTWARCGAAFGSRDRHEAPDGRCSCGLYALHPWNAGECDYLSPQSLTEDVAIIGVVEAWGRVQIHREGFRAQFARTNAFVLVGPSADSPYGRLTAQLARDHRAALLRVRDLEGLIAHCRQENWGLSRPTVASLLQLRECEL
jgi:hypothetical protein